MIIKPRPPDIGFARAQEYPRLGDQLDALMKTMAALREQGVQLPPEGEAWVDACLAVKAKYPKPPEEDQKP